MTKRRLTLLAAPVLALGIALTPAAAASAATGDLTATATGANESVPAGVAGATGATASGSFTADDSTGQFCSTTTGTGLADATMMHIHKGGPKVDGPVVIPLDVKKLGAGKVCVTADKTLLAGIIANPAGYYFNVHTPAFPAGAVRGQLSLGGPTGVAAGTGGQAAGDLGVPTGAILLMAAGVGAVGLAGWRLAKR